MNRYESISIDNYTPVDPKQLFHIHVVILAPDFGIFESISIENSMDYKQHFFMYYCYLGGSMLVQVLREREDTKGEKSRDTGLITNEGVLKKEQDTASRGKDEWEDPCMVRNK